MKHKFKVGDVVEVVNSGEGCWQFEIGRQVTITEAGIYEDSLGYKVNPAIGNTEDGEFGGFIGENSFELVKRAYPNPPHKHAEVIKAWADGADIEVYNPRRQEWDTLDMVSPVWSIRLQYRIKPDNPKKDKLKAKIDKKRAKIKKLQRETASLEIRMAHFRKA